MTLTLTSFSRSDKEDKKWKAVFLTEEGRRVTTHFGYKSHKGSEDKSLAQDYTIHKDKERRKRYLTRHKTDLRTGDPTRAGYLSYYVLWGQSTDLSTNLSSYLRRFGIRDGRVRTSKLKRVQPYRGSVSWIGS